MALLGRPDWCALGTVLPGLPDVVTDAQFLADGHTVLISSVAGTISSWDTRPQRAVEIACDIAGRNLTREEWRDALPPSPPASLRPYVPTGL